MKTVAVMRDMTPEKIAELKQDVKDEQEIYKDEWNDKVDRLKRDRNALFRMRPIIKKVASVVLKTVSGTSLEDLMGYVEAARSIECFSYVLSDETADGITLTIIVNEVYFVFMSGGKKYLAWILNVPATHEGVAKKIEKIINRYTPAYNFHIEVKNA